MADEWVGAALAILKVQNDLCVDGREAARRLVKALAEGQIDSRQDGQLLSKEDWCKRGHPLGEGENPLVPWALNIKYRSQQMRKWLNQETGLRGKSGRKPYDWEFFYIEVIRFVQADPDGLSQNRTRLTEHMIEWCELHWRSVGASTVRERIALIYNTLHLR